MSTRGAYGFTIGGKDKISYNHSDSYPECLGNSIVSFISANSLKDIIKFAKSIKVVESSKKPTALQKTKLENIGLEVKEKSDWYDILREYQGNLQERFDIKLSFMVENKAFLTDSLFCEYAYIINLDDGVLEYYVGFNKQPILNGRFANAEPNESGYYPVSLIKTYALADLWNCDSLEIQKDMQDCKSLEDVD